MNVGDAIKQAVRTGDAAMAAGVVEVLQFQHGLNYDQTFAVVRQVCPDVTLAEWDELLYEADTMGSRG